ncbi:oleate-activated transcription factor [Saccharomycopsis crataegensis]|uniref:Oleate-activated transcription factor n=1 Tax=Saccharomycopsis crataegensis TaxID=43959 RepID=A0AAV5QQD2_9ASCO|nr:oleate-activated transcription factor [Saccharomycopsis crataegensis]
METKRKRNRIPQSCSLCRSRKKKCDKRRPVCTYCLQHGYSSRCHYESEGQYNTISPPYPDLSETSSSGMSQIRSQVSHLKDHIHRLELLLEQKSPPEFDNKSTSCLPSSAKHDRFGQNFEYSGYEIPNAMIDGEARYDFFTGKVFISVGSNSLISHKPLHRAALFANDQFYVSSACHINGFYKHLKQFSKENTLNKDLTILISPLPEKLNEKFKSGKFRFIINMALSKTSALLEYNLKILTSLNMARQNINYFPSYRETFSNENSRASLIQDIERLLPEKPAHLRYLWNIFERYVHPFIPILDLHCFKRDIELIVVGLYIGQERSDFGASHFSETRRCNISLTSFIDFGVLASFLIILRISYCVLKSNFQVATPSNPIELEMVNIDNLQYIGNDYITLASICLSQAKYLTKSSITSMNANILVAYYFGMAEEHGSLYETERVNLLSTIHGLSKSIGLGRDWSNMSFGESGTQPGVDFQHREKLVYISRRTFHSIMRLNVEEFVLSGVASNIGLNRGTLVDLPIRPKYSDSENDIKFINELSVAEELQFDLLVDFDYVKQDEIHRLLLKFETLIHDNNSVNLTEVSSLYNIYKNYISSEFGDPCEYFKDWENFTSFFCARSDSSSWIIKLESSYLIVLNKILQLRRFLTIIIIQVKLIIILINYYEEKQNQQLYSYCLKELFKLSRTSTNIFARDFSIQNDVFLDIESDENFKNFNYRILPLLGRLIILVLSVFGSLIFRSLVSIFLLKYQITQISKNVDPAMNGLSESLVYKLGYLMEFKNTLMKNFEVLNKAYFQKSVRLYYGDTKVNLSFMLAFDEFRRLNNLQEKNDDITGAELFGFIFDIRNDQESGKPNDYTKNMPDLVGDNEGFLRNYRASIGFKFEPRPIPNKCLLLEVHSFQFKEYLEILSHDDESHENNKSKGPTSSNMDSSETRASHSENSCGFIDRLLNSVRGNDIYETMDELTRPEITMNGEPKEYRHKP